MAPMLSTQFLMVSGATKCASRTVRSETMADFPTVDSSGRLIVSYFRGDFIHSKEQSSYAAG